MYVCDAPRGMQARTRATTFGTQGSGAGATVRCAATTLTARMLRALRQAITQATRSRL